MRVFTILLVLSSTNAIAQQHIIEEERIAKEYHNEYSAIVISNKNTFLNTTYWLKQNCFNNQEASSSVNSQQERKIDKIIDRIYFNIGFLSSSVSKPDNIDLKFIPEADQEFQKSIDIVSYNNYALEMKFGYEIYKNLSITYSSVSNPGKHLSEALTFGVSYERPIVRACKKLFLLSSIDYYFVNNGYCLGNYNLKNDFEVGGVNIKAKKIALYVGKKKRGISFNLGLKTAKIYEHFNLFVSGGYRLNMKEGDRLFIYEKSGFFLARKKTDISLKDPSIQYFENGVQTTKTSFDTDDFYLKAGIRFSF